MKIFLFTGLLISITTGLFAQANVDQNLQNYIKSKGYVLLSDAKHLSPGIMPYYQTILDTVKHKYPDLQPFYVLTKSMYDGANIFSVIIYPLSGIELIKKYEDIQTKNQEDFIKRSKDTSIKNNYQIIDDFGGSAGELLLKLNKATHKINFSQFQ